MIALILQDILQTFIHLLISVIPFFVLGIALGAWLESYLKLDFVFRHLTKGPKSIFLAIGLGALLPGCACATIPMAEAIKTRGGSLSTVGSFLMVSPLLGPHTIFLTFGMLGLDFAIARVLFGIVGALILGLVLMFLESHGVIRYPLLVKTSHQDHEGDEHAGHSHSDNACCVGIAKKSFWASFWGMFQRLGVYFLLGLLIAAVLSVLMPPSWVAEFAMRTGYFAPVITTLLGIPIYVCEGEEIPITLSLLYLGLPKGASFSFMMGAVGTCIPTFLMAQKMIGKKATFIYIGMWLVLTPIAGILFGLS